MERRWEPEDIIETVPKKTVGILDISRNSMLYTL